MTSNMFDQDFATLADLIGAHARRFGEKLALVGDDRSFTYSELDEFMNRAAAALQRDGIALGDVVALAANRTSATYAALYLAIIRAGGIAAPLAPSSTAEGFAAQIKDSGATLFFRDSEMADLLASAGGVDGVSEIALEAGAAGPQLDEWLTDASSFQSPVIVPEHGFNIIYSSGTTGVPKGILQSHGMRWAHIRRAIYPEDGVSLLSTPLYSNTTLVSFLPTIGAGGTAVLLPKFDARRFLAMASQYRATHAMLVPVQYARIMAVPDFDQFDLTSFQMKFSTSAPLSAALKRDILDRWPGGLTEFYGMTEGGGTCALACHEHPDKLHTVGKPLPGHDIRLVDDAGDEVGLGETGEVVGHSPAMMKGYHNRSDATAAAEWYSPDGVRFIRTGDVGRFDADGFLTLIDRKKDMIISGGFNIYPSDLEAELLQHGAVAEASVVGVPSVDWGETPVGFVVLKSAAEVSEQALKQWVNARVGKTQRLSDVMIIDSLPRSPIGKVLKRDLRDLHSPAGAG